MTVITTTTEKIEALLARTPVDSQVVVHPIRDDADRAAWAAYIQHDPDGTLFHHPLWAQAVSQVFDHRCHTHLARRGDRVVGVLPLMGMNSFLAGRLLVSMPYATYGGILADDELARDALGGAALRMAYEHGIRQLELRSAIVNLPGVPCDERYAG
ncbi:MAG: hypothetical protein JXO22_04710, partial [Phycisphaerae bacterium]|nr:hypothetical protein [Phycisphaerae bacterium]